MSQWYPHYPGDYLRDTAHLTMQEDGAYHRLLGHYYSTGRPLPVSKEALYRITRAFSDAERAAVDSVLLGFFQLHEDGYHNARADKELIKRAEHHERLSTGARKTNEKRWASYRSATRSVLASPQPQPHKEKTPAAKPTPPADLRFQPFLDFAFKTFEQKHGQKPTWGGKDFKALSVMLASNNGMGAEELEKRFRNYLASTEPFTQKQGDALWYFCTHVDSFLAGPILETSHPNGSHTGKPSSVETTLNGYHQLQQTRAN